MYFVGLQIYYSYPSWQTFYTRDVTDNALNFMGASTLSDYPILVASYARYKKTEFSYTVSIGK